MKFSRLGIIAAMAMALCGQQALAADAPAAGPPKIDPKVHAQSMMDAPPLVQAAGLKCDVQDAYLLGLSDEKINGKTYKASFYEIVCGQGLGYIFKSVKDSDASFYDCMTLKVIFDRLSPAEKAAQVKAKTTNTCGMLPGNADPKAGLNPLMVQSGEPCGSVANADVLGTNPAEKITFFEVSCSTGPGYVLTFPQPGSSKEMNVIPCYKAENIGAPCKMTGKDIISKQIVALDTSGKHPNCMPNRGRWVVTDTANGSEYYELGCADGTTAYMIRTSSKGAFREAIECTLATRIAGGCTFMNVNTGMTAEAATYTKLVKQIGYDACPNVAKYQSYGAENGGQREIVELNCSPTEGAYAFLPTGAGQTGSYLNCVRAAGLGLTCHLTPMEATYAKIAKQIADRGKTTCAVDGGRDIGKDDKGQEYVEVTCGSQPSLVLTYSRLPQETLVSAVPCAQAPIGDACKLKK